MPVTRPEWDKAAVVTIEGGGAYGLSVLGQLKGVLESGLAPIALAGTSAGAIVATLYWAGYSPDEVRQKFSDLAAEGKLVGLLGGEPAANAGRQLAQFERLAKTLAQLIRGVSRTSGKSRARPGCCCFWFCWLLFPLRWILSRLWSFISNCWRLTWCLSVGLWRIRGYASKRGVFSGQVLAGVIDEWIRQAPQLVKAGIELPSGVTFRHIRDVMRANDQIYYPPLFLTATELETGKLVLFNSVDDQCLDIPIGQAVRASAGFPVVFQPQNIHGTPFAGSYADGGLVSNFPSWIYSYEFRRRLRDYHEAVVTPQGEIKKDRYRGLASLPWIHVGLRTQDPPKAATGREPSCFEVLRSLFRLCTGQARDQLETIISTFIARSIIVQQPVTATGGPSHVMAIGEIDQEMVGRMFEAGRQAAEAALSGLTFALPAEEEIRVQLEKLVTQATHILGWNGDNSHFAFRSNVFLPRQEKLYLRYSFNMNSDLDRDLGLEFDLSAGLTGFSFSSRCPQICNLQQIARLAAPQTRAMFGMTPDQQAMVRTDRTWLASVPIFDPGDTVFQADFAMRPVPAGGKRYCTIPSMLDGGLLGILNLDAKIAYDETQIPEDAELHWTDVRIQAILDVMQGTAFRIGEILAKSFASRAQDKKDG